LVQVKSYKQLCNFVLLQGSLLDTAAFSDYPEQIYYQLNLFVYTLVLTAAVVVLMSFK
jgi:hypothetical protein